MSNFWVVRLLIITSRYLSCKLNGFKGIVTAWQVLGFAFGMTKHTKSPYWPSIVLNAISNFEMWLSTNLYVADNWYFLSLSSGQSDKIAILESTSRSSTGTCD